ncbi:hypothetical protein KC19_4G104400 [Ceratodon purpureus]|uniref:AP2/ERF domain-containing protein n=1 Tax=Ceratodon purpureus TaxID=3225 RepID=A0A8T0I923_CERPU|nr:hypothetical protein KC19_4G104400 [Ceratodon purpureus]
MTFPELDKLFGEVELSSSADREDGSSPGSSINSYSPITGGDMAFLDRSLPLLCSGEDSLVEADDLLGQNEGACFSDAMEVGMEVSDYKFEEDTFGFKDQQLSRPGLVGDSDSHEAMDPVLEHAKDFVVRLPALPWPVGIENDTQVHPPLESAKYFVGGFYREAIEGDLTDGFMTFAELGKLLGEAELSSWVDREGGTSSDSSLNSSSQITVGAITFLDRGLPQPRPGEGALVEADGSLRFGQSEGTCFSRALKISDTKFQEEAFGVDNFAQQLSSPGLEGGSDNHHDETVDPLPKNAKDFVVPLPALPWLVGIEDDMQVHPLLENAKNFVAGICSEAIEGDSMEGFMTFAELRKLLGEVEFSSSADREDGSSSGTSANSYGPLITEKDTKFLDIPGLPPPRSGEGEDAWVVNNDFSRFGQSEGACFSYATEISNGKFQEDASEVDDFVTPGLRGEIQKATDHVLEDVKDFVVRLLPALPWLVGVEDCMEVDPLLEDAKYYVGGLPSAVEEENSVHTTDQQTAMEELHIEEAVQVETPGRRWPVVAPGNSIGVNHRGHGTWEAHIWLKDFNLHDRLKPRNGMQCFLGSFSSKEDAMKAHDKVAIKLNIRSKKDGTLYSLNLPEEQYAEYIVDHAHFSRRDYLWKIRRDSEKFSHGECNLKGVRLQKRGGVWTGRYTATTTLTSKINSSKPDKSVTGKTLMMNKRANMTLGTFDTKEEAGREYDKALLFIHGMYSGFVTNFQPSGYSEFEILEAGQKLVKAYPGTNFKEHQTVIQCLL